MMKTKMKMIVKMVSNLMMMRKGAVVMRKNPLLMMLVINLRRNSRNLFTSQEKSN